MPVGTVVADYVGQVPMLLKHDGSPYAGMTYVKAWTGSYNRRAEGSSGVEVVQLADNDEGWATLGTAQQYIDSFTLECWTQGAMEGVKNDIGNTLNLGHIHAGGPGRGELRELPLHNPLRPHRANRLHPLYNRRVGATQVWEAQISNIKVLERTSY